MKTAAGSRQPIADSAEQPGSPLPATGYRLPASSIHARPAGRPLSITELDAMHSAVSAGARLCSERTLDLLREIRRLREALRPLAAVGVAFEGLADGARVQVGVTAGDVREAREMLGLVPPGGKR